MCSPRLCSSESCCSHSCCWGTLLKSQVATSAAANPAKLVAAPARGYHRGVHQGVSCRLLICVALITTHIPCAVVPAVVASTSNAAAAAINEQLAKPGEGHGTCLGLPLHAVGVPAFSLPNGTRFFGSTNEWRCCVLVLAAETGPGASSSQPSFMHDTPACTSPGWLGQIWT